MPRGYVTDTPYADTFFRELSPAWLNYVAALNGIAPRSLERPFNYLELGCGFGTSSVVNAAAFPRASVHACDLNEQHIEGGRAYAMRLGVQNVTFHADSFDALRRRDLPRFDFIVLHGVYSWVDAQTRSVVRGLIDRLVLPGGFVYVSYNALPGWAHELPLRKLLVELAAAVDGDAGEQSERAAEAIEALSDADLRYFSANPGAKSAVEAYRRGEGEYLAHEFMNAAWEPFYAIDVADELATIGLQPVGSATLATNHLPLILDAKAAEAITRLATPRQQQLAIDFATNQRFRRDVFVRPDGSPSHGQYLDATVIGCASDLEQLALTVRVARGEIRFQEPFIHDVRAVMGAGSCTVGDAVRALAGRGEDKVGIARNLLFLVAAGVLAPFAKAARVALTPPASIASPVVERALEDAATRAGSRRAIPSAIYGNGVEMDAGDARAVLDWARGRSVPPGFVERRLPTLARLGLVE